MSIEDFKEKIKQYHADGGKERIFVLLVLVLTASLSFGLGRLSAAPAHESIKVGHFDALPGIATSSISRIDSPEAQAVAAVSSSVSASASGSSGARAEGSVFASKSGTRYYPVGCKSGNRVAEGNKIWFSSGTEAEKIGLSRASGCK